MKMLRIPGKFGAPGVEVAWRYLQRVLQDQQEDQSNLVELLHEVDLELLLEDAQLVLLHLLLR